MGSDWKWHWFGRVLCVWKYLPTSFWFVLVYCVVFLSVS
jgi:hypothetical protein